LDPPKWPNARPTARPQPPARARPTNKLSGVTWPSQEPIQFDPSGLLGWQVARARKRRKITVARQRSCTGLVAAVVPHAGSNPTRDRVEFVGTRCRKECMTLRAPAFPAHPHCNVMHHGKLRLACRKATEGPLGLNSVSFRAIWTRLATFFFTLHQANQESGCARGNQKKKRKGAGSGARNDCRRPGQEWFVGGPNGDDCRLRRV
jgi:hypothetical protein